VRGSASARGRRCRTNDPGVRTTDSGTLHTVRLGTLRFDTELLHIPLAMSGHAPDPSRADAGGAERVESLWLRYFDRIVRHLRCSRSFCHVCLDDEAEDIAQEVFIRLMKRPAADALSPGYVFRVADNIVIDRLRRQARFRRWASHCRWSDATQTIDMNLASAEVVMAAVVSNLSPAVRDAFTLVTVQGLSHRQAAIRLGVTPKAVERRIAKAVEAFRRALA